MFRANFRPRGSLHDFGDGCLSGRFLGYRLLIDMNLVGRLLGDWFQDNRVFDAGLGEWTSHGQGRTNGWKG